MSLWDTLTGRKKKTTTTTESADTAPTSTFGNAPQPFDYDSAADVSSFLGATDPAELHPLAGLGTLDYLNLEDEQTYEGGVIPSRGWSDDLCYGTGTTYLTALSIGGMWGFAEGVNRSPPMAPPKLKLNSILNGMTRRGPFLGNSAAVIAMLYNGINSTIGAVRGKHDTVNSILAGSISGAIFKSTRGVRPMLIASGITGTLAGGWAVTRKAFF